MSKVKTYIDINKEKARHRSRIDETRRTKANRIRKCKNDTYRWIRGGYYHVTERESYRYEIIYNKHIVFRQTDWDHYLKTGEKITHEVTGVYPVYKSKVETIITPVSILKRGSTRIAKYFKTQAKRRYRRQGKHITEDSYALHGNTYRKAYEAPWQVW